MTLTVTPDQQHVIDSTRAFLAAAADEDRGVLAAFLTQHGGEVPDDFVTAAALGAARVHLVHLLAIIDSLT